MFRGMDPQTLNTAAAAKARANSNSNAAAGEDADGDARKKVVSWADDYVNMDYLRGDVSDSDDEPIYCEVPDLK